MTGNAAPWPQAEREIVRRMVAAGAKASEISVVTGRTRKAIHIGVKSYGLGEWTSLLPRAVPDGFAEDAKTFTDCMLWKKYHAGRKTVQRWREAVGILVANPRPRKNGITPREIPLGFREHALKMSDEELAEKYQCGTTTAGRWRKATKAYRRVAGAAKAQRVARPKPVIVEFDRAPARPAKPAHLVRSGMQTSPLDRPYKEDSRAGIAADTLRRDRWTVFRCDRDGNQEQRGQFWRCGRVICTDDELIERAQRAERRLAA